MQYIDWADSGSADTAVIGATLVLMKANRAELLGYDDRSPISGSDCDPGGNLALPRGTRLSRQPTFGKDYSLP